MLYGIYDTKDNIWLGNEKGPSVFTDYTLARVAAQIAECQVYGTDLGCRYQVAEIKDGKFIYVDEVKTRMSSLEALKRIEGD